MSKRISNSALHVVLFVVIFLALQVNAGAVELLNLEQCIEKSLANNPAVLASIARKNKAEWQKKVAYQNFFPMLNMDYSYTYIKDATTIDASFIGAGEVSILKHDNFKMGFQVAQPIFSGFKISETYNLADLGLQEAVAGEQLAQLEIVYQTTAAYFDLLRAIKLQDVKDNEVKMLTAHLKDSESFYKNEKIPLNDLLQSKVHLSNALQGARKVAALKNISASRLATIMKWPLSTEFRVKDEVHKEVLTDSLEDITTKALNMRPELAQANYRLEASKKQIRMAKGEYLPTLNLQAIHNRYGGNPLVDGSGTSQLRSSDETMVGIYANWKLLDWGQRGYKVNEAEAASRAVKHQLVEIMDTVSLEVKSNYEQAMASYTNISPAELAVEQAKENYRMNQLRYKNQLATDTDVLDAQRLLTDTQFNLYSAIYDYQIWLAGLARSAGVASWQEFTR